MSFLRVKCLFSSCRLPNRGTGGERLWKFRGVNLWTAKPQKKRFWTNLREPPKKKNNYPRDQLAGTLQKRDRWVLTLLEVLLDLQSLSVLTSRLILWVRKIMWCPSPRLGHPPVVSKKRLCWWGRKRTQRRHPADKCCLVGGLNPSEKLCSSS